MASGTCHSPGPAGTIARVGVGLLFIGLALFWREPDWQDVALGLVAMPALVVAAALVWARRSPRPLRATGPLGHAVNLALLIPLLSLPATAGAAFLFYGGSMLAAAARGTGGCEVTAMSNALLRRDDQVGCPLFGPLDAVEARLRSRSRPSVGGHSVKSKQRDRRTAQTRPLDDQREPAGRFRTSQAGVDAAQAASRSARPST